MNWLIAEKIWPMSSYLVWVLYPNTVEEGDEHKEKWMPAVATYLLPEGIWVATDGEQIPVKYWCHITYPIGENENA